MVLDIEIQEIVVTCCDLLRIDPCLVYAIIEQESGGKKYAVRYEPGYRWQTQVEAMAAANGISQVTEQFLQAMSFGLMQIMGGTARAQGYRGDLLALTDPQIGLHESISYLNSLFMRYAPGPATSITDVKGWSDPVVAAYNAGSARRLADGRWVNEQYVRSVEQKYHALKNATV